MLTRTIEEPTELRERLREIETLRNTLAHAQVVEPMGIVAVFHDLMNIVEATSQAVRAEAKE